MSWMLHMHTLSGNLVGLANFAKANFALTSHTGGVVRALVKYNCSFAALLLRRWSLSWCGYWSIRTMCLSHGVFPQEFFPFLDGSLGENKGDKVIVVVTLLANVWARQHVKKRS